MARALTFADCADRVVETVPPSQFGSVPYVGLEHIRRDVRGLSGHGTSHEVSSAKRQFNEGDILFGRLRPYLRKIVRAPFDGICSTDIWVFRARPGVDQGFLYHFMASDGFLTHASTGTEGTRMPRARWDHIARYPVRLPGIEAQHRIASALDQIDHTISAAIRLADANTVLRESIREEILRHTRH